MNKKTISTLLLVAGIILLILSLGADMVGLGATPIFGYKQILGSVVGAVVVIAGFFMSRQ